MAQKAVAEEMKETVTEKGGTKEKKQRILLCEGPAEGNGAAYLIFRDDLQIHTNTELTIGKDITEHEAKLLLSENTWEFKEVTK
ncbi:hypothetical protein [Bacillus thuringiensis]|uniref:hypothetical protein n=1 Tax=Bacillus thuringiensis TaxID=1428 RepID=UPI002AB3A822|nr:hypothetical protein [Bacillus thuringiensis]MDY7964990.1 hypothetical protein [Bacillus thuringiensis]